jgi:hypothetical protein
VGILSGVKDAILGKDYQKNTILGKATVDLIERARNATHPFVEEWATECSIAAYSVLATVLLDEQQGNLAFAQFREHRSEVDQAKALGLYKLVACDFLIAFNNEVNDSDFENALEITTDEFLLEVFEIFEFGSEDKKRYNELAGLFSRDTYTEFSTKLYRSALELTCGPEAQPGAMGLTAFTQLVALTYNSLATQFLVRKPQ